MTMIIGTIVLVAGVPSFMSLLRNNELTAAANRLVSALHVARSEAVKSQVWVVVCKSNDGLACTPGSAWRDGWLVFADANGNSVADANERLRVYPALKTGYTLAVSGNFGDWVRFEPSGRSMGSGGGAADTFRLCHGSDTDFSRAIDVSASGRVRILNEAASCS